MSLQQNLANLINFIVIGIFINKNTYIIPTEAYVTYRSVKDTDNVSHHFFTESTHVNPRGGGWDGGRGEQGGTLPVGIM